MAVHVLYTTCMDILADLPRPPYYVVVFSSQLSSGDNGYAEAAARMAELAPRQPGFLGMRSVRDPDGRGITVSYWQDEAAIAGWRRDAEHTATRRRARAEWYEHFEVQVARVERAYRFPA